MSDKSKRKKCNTIYMKPVFFPTITKLMTQLCFVFVQKKKKQLFVRQIISHINETWEEENKSELEIKRKNEFEFIAKCGKLFQSNARILCKFINKQEKLLTMLPTGNNSEEK